MALDAVAMVDLLESCRPDPLAALTRPDPLSDPDWRAAEHAFRDAGSLYVRLERLRNPQRFPWPGPVGSWSISGPAGCLPWLESLSSSMRAIGESMGWQGVSDGSRNPMCRLRDGVPIPAVDPAVLQRLRTAADKLLGMTAGVVPWGWPVAATPEARPVRGRRKPGRRSKSESDKDRLIVAALVKLHRYEVDPGGIPRCGERGPFSGADIARKATVNRMAVSRFLKAKFPKAKTGPDGYATACGLGTLATLLGAWQGEVDALVRAAREYKPEHAATEDDE